MRKKKYITKMKLRELTIARPMTSQIFLTMFIHIIFYFAVITFVGLSDADVYCCCKT